MEDVATASEVNQLVKNAGAEAECIEKSEWVQLDMKVILLCSASFA